MFLQRLTILLTLALALTARAANPSTPSRPAPAQNAPRPPEPPATLIPAHGAASTSFAHSWTESFVTGNGTLGAMVLGAGLEAAPPRPQEDTLSFSHSQLFLPLGTKEVVPQLGDSLPQIRQLIRTRGYGPAVASAFMTAQQQGFPGMMYPDPYLPAFELKLKMPAAGTPRDYLRTENFATGEVAVRWTDDAGTYLRKLFISRPANLAALWIGPAENPSAENATHENARPEKISCELWIPPIPNIPVRTFQMNNPAAAPADAAANALIQAAIDAVPDGITFHAQYRHGQGAGYDAAARILTNAGTTTVTDNHILIADAKSILILLRLEPFAKPTPDSETHLLESLAKISAPYDQLLADHAKIHGELFNRISLDLAAPADRACTTDALLARASIGRPQLQLALLEKLYEGSRYALICSAGMRPPNLQGLWAASWAPTVSLAGDYAFDASFHLALASALSCNTPESLLGLFNLCDKSLPDWQLNAHNLFGVRGILVPMHQSSSGKNLEWSDRSPAGYCWTAGAALLAHWYYDYYLYTGDRQFLAQRGVPFMKQAAAFYEDFLNLDATGKYRFSPSDSTNNAPGDNSAIDIQAATELFTHLIAACDTLHIDADAVARWRRIVARLPPLLVASDGQLQEWALPGISNKPLQRHIPHLYSIFQGGGGGSELLDPETTPELWKAAHAAFDQRFTQWFRAPTSPSDSNPQPIQDRLQMGLCAARFGEGGRVAEVLNRISAHNTYPSMMTQRYEDGRTFVVDAAGAVPEILNRALLDSRPGRIDLLPALPPSLSSGEIRGLAARSAQPDFPAPSAGTSGAAVPTSGRITINSLRWSRTAIDLTLTSTIDQTISVHLPKSAQAPLIQTLNLAGGRTASFHFPQR